MPLIRKPKDLSSSSAVAPEAILESLTRGSEEDRWSAARAAATIADSAPALAAALRSETNARVREAMFSSLARMGTAESAAEAAAFMRSDDANLRTGALDALRLIITKLPQLLTRLLRDDDVDVRILSCDLVRSLPNTEASQLLCNLLAHEPEANVCAAAIDVLAEVATADAIPVLETCARRFSGTPFLVFAIKIVIDRINSSPAPARA